MASIFQFNIIKLLLNDWESFIKPEYFDILSMIAASNEKKDTPYTRSKIFFQQKLIEKSHEEKSQNCHSEK